MPQQHQSSGLHLKDAWRHFWPEWLLPKQTVKVFLSFLVTTVVLLLFWLAGCLLDFLKTDVGKKLKVNKLIDMAAQVRDFKCWSHGRCRCQLTVAFSSPLAKELESWNSEPCGLMRKKYDNTGHGSDIEVYLYTCRFTVALCTLVWMCGSSHGANAHGNCHHELCGLCGGPLACLACEPPPSVNY